MPEVSQNFISNVMRDGHFGELYAQTIIGEKETKELLIKFEQDYPGVTKEGNVNKIAENLFSFPLSYSERIRRIPLSSTTDTGSSRPPTLSSSPALSPNMFRRFSSVDT